MTVLSSFLRIRQDLKEQRGEERDNIPGRCSNRKNAHEYGARNDSRLQILGQRGQG